jgi:hypothetical protein
LPTFNIAKSQRGGGKPLFTNAGQASAAYDRRQFQFGMKIAW